MAGGTALRTARERLGLSIQVLAQLTTISLARLEQIEAGEMPTPAEMVSLCMSTAMDPSELTGQTFTSEEEDRLFVDGLISLGWTEPEAAEGMVAARTTSRIRRCLIEPTE